MVNDLDLLAIQYRTLFVTDASDRIIRENDPDHSPGPRLWLAGCASGNVAGLRSDLADPLAAEIMALLATEPPLFSQDSIPQHLDRYIDILARTDSSPAQSRGATYELPNGLKYGDGVSLVDSESEEGERLFASLSRSGLPASLLELGFRNVSEFWNPWCMALYDGQVASVAFAARLSETGAELGIATVQALRGRGYAAAAAAGWSGLASLQSRTLFYSTQRTNISSQKVAARRLGLRYLGSSLRLY